MAANCGHCHRPGGVPSPFDARLQVPLSDVILAPTQRSSSQQDYLVSPGLPGESELFLRDDALDAYGMPPVGKSMVDQAYVDLLNS